MTSTRRFTFSVGESTEHRPTVKILLGTFNGSHYLREQLRSISNQDYEAWHLYACDDGSSDNTVEILEEFQEAHPGKVDIQHSRYHSAKMNFFNLIRTSARAEYTALCDQDDVWMPYKLSMLVSSAERVKDGLDEGPILLFSDAEVVDESLVVRNSSLMAELHVVPTRLEYRNLLVENAIPGCTMFMNDKLVALVCKYQITPQDAIMHDWWIALLAATTGRVSFVDQALIKYRQHSNNTLGSVSRGGFWFVWRKLHESYTHQQRVFLYRQAAEFAAAYGGDLPPEVALTIRAFGAAGTRSKIERLEVMFRHHIWKQTIPRRIYQLICA